MSVQKRASDSRRLHLSKHAGVVLTISFLDMIAGFAAAGIAFFLCSAIRGAASIGSILAVGAALGVATVATGCYRDSLLRIESGDITRRFIAAFAGSCTLLVLAPVLPAAVAPATSQVLVSAVVAVVLWIALRLAVVQWAAGYSATTQGERTIIVGAGDATATLIDIARRTQSVGLHVVGCVDDTLHPHTVNGVPFLGTTERLPELIARMRIACVVVAVPNAPTSFVNKIVATCTHALAPDGKAPRVKVLPSVSDLLNGKVTISRLRDIRLEDLLQRDPVHVDLSAVTPHLRNRVVLVTGAGGSIGSELCRQIATFEPSLLLLLGHGENSLFAIEQELRLNFAGLRTEIVLADIADGAHIRSVFSKYRPHVVFHAAAHKHVPIVEQNVCEAVRNNVFGTHTVALAAAAAGVAKFILLSTDKAVNPTSVMGATKRASELTVQSLSLIHI